MAGDAFGLTMVGSVVRAVGWNNVSYRSEIKEPGAIPPSFESAWRRGRAFLLATSRNRYAAVGRVTALQNLRNGGDRKL